MTPESSITEFFTNLEYHMLSDQVVAMVKRLTLNTLAAMIAGSSAGSIVKVSELVRSWKGNPESSIFLHDTKVPVLEAAFVNAAMSRVMDFDDFHMETGVHASSTVIPTALAIAEAYPVISGENYITAVAAGCEMMCRMRSVPDQCIGVSGWTGEIYGAFGAAVAAGKILNFDEETMIRALGLASAQCSGTSQSIYDGTEATCLQQGFSARAGVLAALMARAGLSGAHNFLTGRAGFYPVYYRGMDYRVERLLDDLGKRYLFLGIATKPYPSCGFTMAPIENALSLMKNKEVKADSLERVKILVNKRMYATVCAPVDAKYAPLTPADALFSMPYAVATAILKGDVRLEDFSPEALKQKERLDFMKRIDIVEDEEIEEKALKANLPLGTHSLEFICKDGKRFEQDLQYATGFPQKPMTMDECADKAKKVLAFAFLEISENKINRLKEDIEKLESQRDMINLINYIF